MGQVLFPETFETKTILVTGAAGFIGSTLSEFYLNKGAKVIGVDNFLTGSRSNIELLSKYENFCFEEHDLSKNISDFKGVKIDNIFNMASPASPIDFTEIPIEIMKVNAEGTHRVLELALEKKARFLQASTSEVYGDPEIHPQTEDYFGNVNPIGVRSCYDESKRYAEAMVMCYNRYKNVETRMIRIFNTYGPRMRPNDGRVIPNFINQALNNEDITIYGDGSQTRSFCYVTDLVDGIHNVMFSDDPTPFNVGNPDEYSILDCAQEVIKALESQSKLSYVPMPHKDDPKRRRPNIDKLQSVSDFSPKVSFTEGIRKTAEYFKKLES